jgi:predicted enzyme related to lactoylglutathione lyase
MVAVQPVILTPDIDRAHRFYTELFGARLVQRVPDEGPPFYLGLAIDDGIVGLVADEAVDLDSPTRVLVSIDVADVDTTLRQVEGLGGIVLGPPTDMPWRQRVAHIRDPDGNAVNLTGPPAARRPSRSPAG